MTNMQDLSNELIEIIKCNWNNICNLNVLSSKIGRWENIQRKSPSHIETIKLDNKSQLDLRSESPPSQCTQGWFDIQKLAKIVHFLASFIVNHKNKIL